MNQTKVLIVYGGESSEHDVSLASAKNVANAIDRDRYSVTLCYIDRDGRWWLQKKWHENPDDFRTTQLVVAPGTKTLLTVPGSATIAIDVLYPVLHGKLGEDGAIQGLADMLHVSVVGCSLESSAVCMNKDATKRLAEAAGIPVVPWVSVTKGFDRKDVKRRAKALSPNGPWFVKPARAGSSVGVSKVASLESLDEALAGALQHDDMALIEVAIDGRELEVAVLGNSPRHKASGVGEIIAGNEFYDYDDKYASNSTSQVVLDAKLPSALAKVIRRHALDVFRVLGCRGMARVDFLLSDDLIPYLNEVNTLPGFTDISMYPKLWHKKNLSQTALITRLIESALE